MSAMRVHRSVLSWAWDLLKEKKRYKDWQSWSVNALNRVIMIVKRDRSRKKPICKVNYKALSAPVYVRLGSPDLWVLDELFASQEYKVVVQTELGEVKQIVDLGANAGMSIRFWLNRWPEARVIGVEPDDLNFQIARLNADQHRGGKNVRLVNACVAGCEKTVALDRTHHESMYAMTDPPRKGAMGGELVPALPMEKILEECEALPTIDLLKVDIEGAEREVFKACAPWIGRVRYMIPEVHPPYTTEELQADLRSSGANFRVIDRHPSEPNEIVFLRAEGGPVLAEEKPPAAEHRQPAGDDPGGANGGAA